MIAAACGAYMGGIWSLCGIAKWPVGASGLAGKMEPGTDTIARVFQV